ncbi:universal stress protein [Desulfonatronospira sp.]|uniref:universal stress protein n=1 Tax=Desulfonatronospira sp. TaxID=1962951 RepID=UPI0025BDB609|nr:universal stress protein [Desulfonatronospira sp.]
MLQRAAVKISLKEPRKKLVHMFEFLGNFGTRDIHLIHATPKITSQHRREIEEQLEKTSKDAVNFGFNVYTHILSGHVPTSIIETAEEKKAGFIAIFWMPKSLFRNALFGNIDSDILRLSNLPVFIYNPGLFRSSANMEQVLYATDFKHTDAAVLPYLVDRRFTASKLNILHVGERAPDPATEEKRRKNVLGSLNALARQCAHAYDSVQTIETIGQARKQIVKQAAMLDADLIVVGKSDRADTVSRMMGSTAEILPHRAGRSVFIIPVACRLPFSQNNKDSGFHGT